MINRIYQRLIEVLRFVIGLDQRQTQIEQLLAQVLANQAQILAVLAGIQATLAGIQDELTPEQAVSVVLQAGPVVEQP